ncbi:MAG: OmpA family protein [Haliscomenobacter sp.]|nr:OmpA family protein [Haliscomenobacter sp.]
MDAFAGVLRDSFQRHPAGQWEVQLLEGQAVLILSEPLLFKSGVTAKVEPLGLAALKTLADILAQYPSLFVDVVGHHDNQPLPRKVLADVWDYTTLRANTVVRTMVRDMELSPGRVLAAGKGPFAPRQSNETATGQAANRRVEFVIFPSANALPKKILELLSQ